jgi:predicted nicotinamide N-methyase
VRRVTAAEFVLGHTRVRPAPFVPELRMHLADEALEVWEATQVAVDHGELPPPFWAFVWAGGQALARHLLDRPEEVAGRRVVDVASGSGIVALAAATAGAADVAAYDVDELAVAAIRLNTRLNGQAAAAQALDVRQVSAGPGDLVTAGDVFYDERLAAVMLPELSRLARAGATVLVGDPHRAYLPRERLRVVASYDVDVEPDIEDAPVKETVVAEVVGAPAP